MTTLAPATEAELVEAVASANAAGRSLELLGRGSKRAMGRPLQVEATLDLSRFSGVVAYEPNELLLTAGPATPLAEIEALLAGAGQALAFEPPDFGPLLGAAAGAGSLGGAIAVNLAGPRRFKAGAARDHLLGFKAVTGGGARFKSGGRVVKNVTGYDLSKLIAGSWGTLAAMTELTVKVLPAGETLRTLVLLGLDAVEGGLAMTAALLSSCEVSGAAWLPAAQARALRIDPVAAPGSSVTALRLEGPEPSVLARLATLRSLLPKTPPQLVLEPESSRPFWRAVADARGFVGDSRPLWRLTLTPTSGPQVLHALELPEEDTFLDWGGGLLWVTADRSEALLPRLEAALSRHGGAATLVRGPAALRASVHQLPSQPPALLALAKRVKAGFDPKGVFNPGRIYAGI
ncbi:MAG TPA: FAD-binding protein [Kiloniellales bacterium]|nr:FAD-binding protein [Kiloniellales bacterium]